MIWPFNRKTVKWSSLSPAQRHLVARKLGGVAMGMFGRGYEAVSSPFSSQRRPSIVEKKGEDGQTTTAERLRIVNMHRDMMRNSPTRMSQDQQIRVNVVGAVGGKLYPSFGEGYEKAAEEVAKYFNNKWFPRAEFTFRKNFNWLLKTVLTAQDVNGNVVLVFDDGILTGGDGTGRVRGFEGDEIANVSDADFKAAFGAGCVQRNGIVYNSSGMMCGVFVSTAQRGQETFDHGKFITLRCDPFDDAAPVNWMLLGDMRRFNQGRAVSPLTAAINCLVDLHEIAASEAQAAKLNAQLVGQILEDAGAATGPDVATPFDDDTTDAEALGESVEFSTAELRAIGAHFDKLPPGLKIELLDSKRPNPNMPAYIDHLTGLVGSTRGLARVYSTMRAQTSYTAFRGEQVMTESTFEEARQDLERDVCDWVARCVISRAVRRGEITAALPDGWENMIAWTWPRMREVSETDAQNALKLKLQNGVTSLQRELGPGEVFKVIAEQKAEKKLFDDAGLIYPSETTVSGVIKDAMVDQDGNPIKGKPSAKQDDDNEDEEKSK